MKEEASYDKESSLGMLAKGALEKCRFRSMRSLESFREG